MKCKILKLIVTMTTPFQGRFVTERLAHAMVKQPTKFEVHVFTSYGNVKGVAKCRKWGG